MRIQRLSFDFFGRFTGKAFDFGEAKRPSDFHVIYGPNEAGKTTVMEGYLRLLYGFPHREPYGFQHRRQNLRIAGVLELDGETRSFTRLPSRTGNLRGEAWTTLPETAIASHMGGLSLEDYRNLLCLDDETIEKGGDDIANARGDIGRLLFSAAAGVADLNAVLAQAQSQANNLYRKRASSTRVAESKRELGEIDRQIKGLDVSASAWRKLKEALQAAENEEADARTARDDLRVEQAQTAALSRALPNLGELDRLLDEIADYSDYPERIDINSEDLVSLKTEQGKTEAEVQRLKGEIEKAEKERTDIVPDEERLALAGRLDDLDELRSRMTTAKLDLPRRRRAHKDAEANMARIARELGAPEGCDVTRMVKSPADIAALESVRDAMRDASTAKEAEAREIGRLQTRVMDARNAHKALLDNAPPQNGLLELLSRFDADTLASAAAAARQAVASSEESLQDALDALSVVGCAFAVLPDCQVDQSTAKDLAERHAGLMEKFARSEETLERHEEDVAVKTAKIAKLAASVGVASDEDARNARDRRDVLWQAHRDKLTAESADAFEPSMKQVDDIEGARLAHATKLGELRQLEQALVAAETREAKTKENLEKLKLQASRIEARVEDMASAIGRPKLSPAGFSDWVERHGLAAAAQRQKVRLAEQHRATLEQAECLHEALRPLVSLENPTFEAALAAARRIAEEERRQQDKQNAASDTEADLEEQLQGRRPELAALDETAGKASETWVAIVQELFGGLLPHDTLAGAFGQLRDTREHDVKRLQAARQVSAMEHDQRQFADAMITLNVRYDLDEDDPLEAFRLLRDEAEQAQADKIRHDNLSAKIEDDMQKLQDLEAQRQDIDRRVGELGALFPETADTGTLDALRITVVKAQDIITKRARITDLEGQIRTELSVRMIDEARTMLENASAPALAAKAKSLEADLESAEARLSAATVARANAARDVGAVTGNAEIAELVERRTTLRMQIEETILDYLERNFGLRLAEEAIRRYRDKHRSGMMEATEHAFSELTTGAYEKLLTQPDGSSEILLAVDANGTPKQIGDMSKGTRFQLYLALRAAAYEQMVWQGVQLPFFCDDVFETFDDDRTRAACRLMERIGRSGQAIYLTHHRHVVEIAKEVCDAQPIIHEL